MGLIKSVSDAAKRFFTRQDKKKTLPSKETFLTSLPPPIKEKPKTLKFKRGYTKHGIKKHSLHAHHFGTFSPMKPI